MALSNLDREILRCAGTSRPCSGRPQANERGPRQKVRQASIFVPVFTRLSMTLLTPECVGVGSAAHHVHELGVSFCSPDRRTMADAQQMPAIQRCRPRPMAAASVPHRIATERGAPPSRICSVSARWTGASNPAMGLVGILSNQRPAAERKERQEEARSAKAMDSPKTICTNLRNPPDVSPKASDRPVTVMMITETIFATGPCTDWRMELSGVSHGMFEPAAYAGALQKDDRAAMKRFAKD